MVKIKILSDGISKRPQNGRNPPAVLAKSPNSDVRRRIDLALGTKKWADDHGRVPAGAEAMTKFS